MNSQHKSPTVAVVALLGLFLADRASVAQSAGGLPEVTNADLKELQIELVTPTKDPQTGSVVGGENGFHEGHGTPSRVEPARIMELLGPVLADRELPEPARWPALRYERPLRMLVVAEKRHAMSAYRRIALRLRSRVDYCYVGVDDMVEYHVNDKWIEPKDQPTRDELAKAVLASAVRRTQVQDGRPVADVIVVSGNPANVLDEPAIAANLLANVRAGAALIACGSVYPKTESPLAAVWPMQPKPENSWMGGGATRTSHAALAGVPVSHLAGHQWIPFAEVTEGSTALATGESGSAFLRTVERGAVVTIPMGPISRHWAAIDRLHRRYDHDEIWLRLWDQLLYELVRGDRAFPAYGDLQPVTDETPAGQQAVVEGQLVNRTLNGPLAVAVHVANPRGEVVFRQEETVELASGAECNYPIHIPVGADWPSGMYRVALTVGDATNRRQVHQAMEYLTVAGRVKLNIAADRPGYQTGEQATFTVAGVSLQPWRGELALGVYDFRGRLLGVETQPAELAAEPREFRFQYRLADHGVRVDTYWAVVVARSRRNKVEPSFRDGKEIAPPRDASTREWARAETKVYKHDRWSMRNEYQWSTWAGIACGPPSTVPAGMRLMAHAGMNALGYPGRNELYYPAERWGWRYYNEGIGMNTFAPVIEYENDAEIETALLKEAERSFQSTDLASAAFVLGSVGEEAGFKHGWGTRYYWDTPIAPDKACRAFRWFLGQKYTAVADLNAAWRTNYGSWEDVKLTREFSARAPKPEADGWAHPKDSPLGSGVTAVSLSPFADTAEFYNWYYDRIVGIARRISRERINPVTLAISSAPTIGSGEYDARQTGPSAWNESQWHSIADGPEPGFGLIWGHFDWSVKTDNMFWGFLLMRSGHNNYWVDVPLMFNNDLTHTRSSFAMRQWTHRLAGHERIILDSRPAPCDVGLLGPNGVGLDNTRGNMAISLQVALSQAGFGLPASDPSKLGACKIVFAIGRQAVSAQEAERLQRYVAGGGTLVFTPRFADQPEAQAKEPSLAFQTGLQDVVPGCSLAEQWKFRVTDRSPSVPQYHSGELSRFPLDGLSDTLRGAQAAGLTVFREQVQHEGWTTLAEYADHRPAILTRTMGQGRLVYLNAVYQSHHYIQWVTPTDADRQGFYQLVEWLCEQAGAKRTLRLDGRLDERLHVAVKQFTDPTGHIRYAILRTSGEVPWVACRLQWLGPETACYDVLGGEMRGPAPALGTDTPFVFRPGEGRLLALTAAPVKRIHVTAAAPQSIAGQPLALTVQVLDDADRPVPGSFPLELQVSCDGREVAGLDRSFSAESGHAVTLQTAFSDPDGSWTVRVRDGITGLEGVAAIEVSPAPAAPQGPGFVPWGWPSELEEPGVMPADPFVSQLQQLSRLYLTDHSGEGWMTKQRLGYYYDLFPETRHALLRPLLDVNWSEHVAAIRQAVESGQTLMLTGEDLDLHPGSGLDVYPHRDAQQLPAIHAALSGAKWSRLTVDGDTVSAALGSGRLILCRESIDAAGHDNTAIAGWQRRWLGEVNSPAAQTIEIPPPTQDELVRWWTGQRPIGADDRQVTWFAGNQREIKLQLDPKQPLRDVLLLTAPPTGAVKRIQLSFSTKGEGVVSLDVGCDGTIDAQIRSTAAAGTAQLVSASSDWLETAARQLQASVRRDGSGWRLCPIRVTATGPVEVSLTQLQATVGKD